MMHIHNVCLLFIDFFHPTTHTIQHSIIIERLQALYSVHVANEDETYRAGSKSEKN